MPKLTISIVGPGRLGKALTEALAKTGYRIDEIVFHTSKNDSEHSSQRNARKLSGRFHAHSVELGQARLSAPIIWLCVGDGSIAQVAESLSKRTSWRGKVVFHSSGALTSRELASLKREGASVASVHPMMSFVHHGAEATFEVPFALEGDVKAIRVANGIVRSLGGHGLKIPAGKKPLYHAFGAFVSPLIIANVALAERIGVKAGVPKESIRQAIAPILATTVFNYITLGPTAAFSGPLVRGDASTVRKNLIALKNVPEAQDVYRALARSALRTLPVKNRKELQSALRKEKKS